MIAVITGRGAPTEAFRRRQHAPLKLIVVIGVEQVVLAVVLVLHNCLHLAQATGEVLAGRRSFIGCAVGITAPIEVNLGQVVTALP
ncbi:hypothetical protein D3C76_1654350 [compost metagenome]